MEHHGYVVLTRSFVQVGVHVPNAGKGIRIIRMDGGSPSTRYGKEIKAEARDEETHLGGIERLSELD